MVHFALQYGPDSLIYPQSSISHWLSVIATHSLWLVTCQAGGQSCFLSNYPGEWFSADPSSPLLTVSQLVNRCFPEDSFMQRKDWNLLHLAEVLSKLSPFVDLPFRRGREHPRNFNSPFILFCVQRAPVTELHLSAALRGDMHMNRTTGKGVEVPLEG